VEREPYDAEAGRPADCGGEPGQDPPGDHDAGDPQPRADLLHDQVARQLEDRIAPVEGAERKAEGGSRHPQIIAHRQRRRHQRRRLGDQQLTAPKSEDWGKVLDTGVARMPGMVFGLPNTLANLYMGISGDKSGIAPFIAQHTYSPDEITQMEFKRRNYLNNVTPDSPDAQKPYNPVSLPGQITQDTIAGAPVALVGGGGIPGMIMRQASNLGGNAAADTTTAMVGNDHPGLAAGAGLLGAILAERIPSMAGTTAGGVGTFAKGQDGANDINQVNDQLQS
jgi:hypothetical protein